MHIETFGDITEPLFVMNTTQFSNYDTLFGKIIFKNVKPLVAPLNIPFQHYLYSLSFMGISNIIPFDNNIWYKISIVYERPIRTLIYDFTNETNNLNVIDYIQPENSSVDFIPNMVVPLNISSHSIDVCNYTPLKMQITYPNLISYNNLPSWEYCKRMNIPDVLCLQEDGILRISNPNISSPSLEELIDTAEKARNNLSIKILQLQPIEISAITLAGTTLHTKILKGILSTVEICNADSLVYVLIENTETTGMYYTLSEYTVDGCVLTIYNVTDYLIGKLRLNGSLMYPFERITTLITDL